MQGELMALEFTTRSPVTCKVCKKPAVRRTIAAEGLHVSYDTHVHAGHKEHFAALERLDRFHLLLERRETAKALQGEGRRGGAATEGQERVGRLLNLTPCLHSSRP